MNNFNRLSALILIFSALGCRPTAPSTESTDHRFDAGGVSIRYSTCGAGDTSLVFIHGWCINRGYWSGQVAHFCPKYRVVTLDLPGFGESGKNRQSWSIETYGADAAALIQHLGLKNVILVGHSMSGDIMLETAALCPKQVIRVIGIDNLTEVGHVMSDEERAGVAQFFDTLRQNYVAVVTAFAGNNLFQPSTDSLVRARVLADFTGADPSVAVPVLQSLFMYSDKESARIEALRVPLCLVNSDAGPTDTAALKKACAKGFRFFTVHATGHYPMVEAPEEFNRQLEKAVLIHDL